jgi:hypothetical protein
MPKPDTSVAIASWLFFPVLMLLVGCNRMTASSLPDSDISSVDGPAVRADTDSPDSSVDAVGSRDDAPLVSGQALDAGGDAQCALLEPIAGAGCDRCLAQHCCPQAQQCPVLATQPGGLIGPGCRNGLRCIRQCPDAGECRLDLPGARVLACSGGFGPQLGNAMMAFLVCAGQHCPVECAQGL